MYHLYADIVGAKNERGELRRASNPCGGFPAELPAGSCCQPLLPVLDHLQEPKVWTELRCVLVSLGVQPLPSCSGAGSRALLCWKCKMQSWVWVGFFHPGKIPSTLILSRINFGGSSLARSPGSGWDVWQTGGGQGHPILPAASPPTCPRGWQPPGLPEVKGLQS